MIENIGSRAMQDYYLSQSSSNIVSKDGVIDFDKILTSELINTTKTQNASGNLQTQNFFSYQNTAIMGLSNKTVSNLLDEILKNEINTLKEAGISLSGTENDILDKFYNTIEDKNLKTTDLIAAISYSRVQFLQGANINSQNYFNYLENIILNKKYPH